MYVRVEEEEEGEDEDEEERYVCVIYFGVWDVVCIDHAE